MQTTLQHTDTSAEPATRPYWRDILLVTSLLITVAALAALWLTRPPGEGSREVVFARDMIAHHEQAVEMAFTLYGRDGLPEELRIMTQDIMFTQHGQVGQMQGWLTVWGQPLASGEAPMGGMGLQMGMATREQIKALETLPLAEAEVQFLQLMIRHHQGGVMMAETVLGSTRSPEVERLAQAIVASQQSEITVMSDMLAKRGAQPLPALPPMDMDHGH